MEDVPPNMPFNAYGAFEPYGMCVWVNQDNQSEWTLPTVSVLSHEFTHYVHAVSTWHAIDDLITLLYQLHAGIQRLEELSVPIQLPLRRWAQEATVPDFVREFVAAVSARNQRISDSMGSQLDSAPPVGASDGETYVHSGHLHIRTTANAGVPVLRLALLEGAALAKKCETVGNSDDLISKKKRAGLSHYFALHDACGHANPYLDPLTASQFLCDMALCSPKPADAVLSGLGALGRLPAAAGIDDFKDSLLGLYDSHCSGPMTHLQNQLEQALSVLPKEDDPSLNVSWGRVALENSLAAVEKRQRMPLSLIEPQYLGAGLHVLAKEIGSPVVITNDMRLTGLAEAPLPRLIGRNSLRTIRHLSSWLFSSEPGRLECPYAGCPGCPDGRRGEDCITDARRVIAIPDSEPWCALHYSAHQLRIVPVVRADVEARPCN